MKKNNTAYQADIIRRMYKTEKEFLQFDSDYQACKMRRTRNINPSKKDFQCFELWKKGLSVTEIAKDMGLTYAIADSAINRVSRSIALLK